LARPVGYWSFERMVIVIEFCTSKTDFIATATDKVFFWLFLSPKLSFFFSLLFDVHHFDNINITERKNIVLCYSQANNGTASMKQSKSPPIKRQVILNGMTNYRIDRIGTYRHASTRIGAIWPHRHGKTGAGVWTYSFRVLILGRLLAK